VLVWIHGGAFAYGQSNDYDPSALVAQGLIVVTVNYRLGALGFLSHPALSAEQGGKSGNYGLMDQQAALRWVKNNIANFGGNPSNVTIAGESAGGFSVHAHLAAAGSRGLFQKAIAMSGAYPFAVPQDTLAQAEAKGTTVATTAAALISQAVGTTVPPCTTAACLRGLPVNVLFAGAQAAYPQGPIPPVDGAVLTEDVRTTISAGRHAKVPVIEGTTRDEWRLFAALDEYTAALSATPPKPFEAVLKTNADYVAKVTTLLGGPANPDAATAAQLFTSLYYPASLYPSITEAYSALGTDLVFACNGRIAALELQQHAPVYAYEFRDRTAPAYLPKRADFNLGASHTSELQYLFNVTNAPGTVPTTLNSSQKSLASTMVKYWANFAKTGNPNALGLRNWSRFTATSDTYQGLDIGLGGVGALSINFKTSHNCSAWNGFKDYTPTP
jgi:para-nitrobenzyl esterase